jgi:DNA-binding transcriptional LysR family regulator
MAQLGKGVDNLGELVRVREIDRKEAVEPGAPADRVDVAREASGPHRHAGPLNRSSRQSPAAARVRRSCSAAQSNDTLLLMVRAGMGSAVLPWLAIRGAAVTSDDRLGVHEIYLHWRSGHTQSPLTSRAIEIAVEVAAELAPPPARPSAGAHPGGPKR